MKILILLISILNFIYADASFEIERYSYIGDIQKVKEHLQKSKTIPHQALLNAAYKNHTKIVKLLVQNGADIKAQSSSGRDVLYYAVQNNNLELLKYLLYHGGEFRDNNFGNDALFEAVEYGYLEIVKYLLAYFKHIDRYYLARPDWDLKTTLLITAIQNNHLDIAKLLIKNGADINLSNTRGETPLLTSLRNKHFEMARYLIKKGSDLSAQDIAGNNAFTYALTLKQKDIALQAIEYVDVNQFVNSAIFDGKPYIYEYYIVPSKKEWQFASYLHLAIRYGEITVIERLLQKGLRVDTLLQDKRYKLDALQLAIYYSDLKTVKYLIQKGANPYKKYHSSLPWGRYNTLLSYAMLVPNTPKNKEEIINYLLTLPNASWYHKYEDMQKIKKFLLKKPKVDNTYSSDQRLQDGLKNNDYIDIIYATKENHKLISATKEMLKRKQNINQERFTNYTYRGTLLLEYFKQLEFNIKLNEIKQLLKMGATLGDSQEALKEIYLLYNTQALKLILKDKLFEKQSQTLHKKYDLTEIAISIYKDKHLTNKRVEWMLELVYRYKLNFDFEKFKKIVDKDDLYINKLIKYYKS